MVFRSFERRLEDLVTGAVGRLFGGGLRPVELGHRIIRSMNDSRSVGVKGQTVVANEFDVEVSVDDHDRFAEIRDSLIRELCDAAREHARDEGWRFMGPVQVSLEASENLRVGQINVTARMKEGDGANGVLHLADGQQVVLGAYRLTLGRLATCTVSFDDTNVSREHAEIRPDGNGYVLIDMASTNGTSVNGELVTQRRLVDGDRIALGASTQFEFRAG